MLPGIDVSKYQGLVDWERVAEAGVRFSFIRTGDGIDHTDPLFGRNWEGAHKASVLRGPYHFLRCSVSPQLQADALIDSVYRAGIYLVDDLPPVCDLELDSMGAGVTAPRAIECALAFAASISSRIGRAPILYTSPAMLRVLGKDADRLGTRFPTLFIAHYGVERPSVLPPYNAWAFWQYSCSGSVDGVPGPVDLDWFNGDEAALRDLVEISEVLA